MKSIWNVMLEFDPCKWTLANMLCIQNHKFSAVSLWNIELNKNIAIIFIALFAASPAKTGDKNRFTHTAMRVPDLAMFMLHVMLCIKVRGGKKHSSHTVVIFFNDYNILTVE